MANEKPKMNADEMLNKIMQAEGLKMDQIKDRELDINDVAIIALKFGQAAITALLSMGCIPPEAMIEILNKVSKLVDSQVEVDTDDDEEE
jgi:hypothetical protein